MMSNRKRSASTASKMKMTPFKRLAPFQANSFSRIMTRPSNQELKFTDNTTTITPTAGVSSFVAFTGAAGAGASQLLNGLVPDSTATGRIGRRVIMKSLYIRVLATLATTSTQGAPIRMLVVYDKQSNGAAPAVTDVMTTNSFISVNNISNRDRFVTLCDQVLPNIGTGGNFTENLVVYKKINLPVQYNAGTAGTIADITSGSIYITFAQGGTILTVGPSITYYARVRYTDS